MLTYLRYALATVCFAASVGCLALWRRDVDFEWCVCISKFDEFILTVWGGRIDVEIYRAGVSTPMNCRPTGSLLVSDAILLAFTGFGILRFGRYTLRSAIIATTVVAGLLGVAVGM